MKKNDNLLPALMKEVEGKIVEVRGQKTLLDFHVAALYGVETKRVNRRTSERRAKQRLELSRAGAVSTEGQVRQGRRCNCSYCGDL